MHACQPSWIDIDRMTNHAQKDARRVTIVEYCRYVTFVTDLSVCGGNDPGDVTTLTFAPLASGEKTGSSAANKTAHKPH